MDDRSADVILTDSERARHDLNNVLSLVLAYAERAIRAADDATATRAILSDLIACVRQQAAPQSGGDRRD